MTKKFQRKAQWWCSGVAAAMALALGVGAAEAPPDYLRVYGEERQVVVEDEWGALSRASQGLIGSVKRKPTAFEAAMKTAHDLAAKAAKRSELEAVRKAMPPGNDAQAYRLLGVRESARGNPSATLACFVLACDSDPKKPEAFFDLAGCLALLGYANEALAILDELAKRGARPEPAVGLTPEDVIEYDRGYCLLRLGDQAGARALLEKVAARQPLLSEASKLLALLDEAEGKNSRKNFLLGVWRRKPNLTVATGRVGPASEPEPDAFATGDEVGIDLRQVLNMSKGRDGQLPGVRYAGTPEDAWALYVALQQKQKAVDAQMDAYLKQERTVLSRLRRRDADGNPTWGEQLYDLMLHLDWRDPKLREFTREKAAVAEGERKASDLRSEQISKGQDAFVASKDKSDATEKRIKRPYFVNALALSLPAFQKGERLTRDTFAEWHRLATAIGANLGDPGWREVFRLRIEARRAQMYSRMLGCSIMHSSLSSRFWDPANAEAPGNAEAQDMAQCDGKRSVGVSLSGLAVEGESPVDVGVEITCDGMSVEAGFSVIPGLQYTAEIGLDTKGGYSVFVGPRGTGTLEITDHTSVASTTKGGWILSGNKSGVTEVGMKIESKLVANAGPFSVATKTGETSITYVPAPPTPPPEAITPLVIHGLNPLDR